MFCDFDWRFVTSVSSTTSLWSGRAFRHALWLVDTRPRLPGRFTGVCALVGPWKNEFTTTRRRHSHAQTYAWKSLRMLKNAYGACGQILKRYRNRCDRRFSATSLAYSDGISWDSYDRNTTISAGHGGGGGGGLCYSNRDTLVQPVRRTVTWSYVGQWKDLRPTFRAVLRSRCYTHVLREISAKYQCVLLRRTTNAREI